MFTVNDRDRVRDHVLQMAASDARVVAGAVVGSLAHSEGDRWSDLDLTFGVNDAVPIDEVLNDFTVDLVDTFDAAQAVRDHALGSLVTSLDRDELLRALACAIELLLAEADEAGNLATQVEPQLRSLAASRLQ
jgi:hypothetical protein